MKCMLRKACVLTSTLIGYSDLGEVNNLLSDYKQQLSTSEETPRLLGKCMLMFMVRGLFTNLKFPYVQFPANSTKGANIFPLVRQAIKHLSRLGLHVITVTCDGASDNRRCLMMRPLYHTRVSTFSVLTGMKYFLYQIPHT